MANLTRGRLKELLTYDPATGLFRWAIKHGKVSPGMIAGYIGGPRPGYVMIGVDGRTYYGHRLAWLYMTGEWPARGLDHRNRKSTDNKWRNLRPATKSQNAINCGLSAANSSGYRGVFWHRGASKWQACVTVNGRSHYLGLFVDIKAAARAYRKASRQHHGEFAA